MDVSKLSRDQKEELLYAIGEAIGERCPHCGGTRLGSIMWEKPVEPRDQDGPVMYECALAPEGAPHWYCEDCDADITIEAIIERYWHPSLLRTP